MTCVNFLIKLANTGVCREIILINSFSLIEQNDYAIKLNC